MSQPAGAPAFCAASDGGSAGSQFLAMNRRPVTPFEFLDISQTIGAIITSGCTSLDRSGTSSSGIIRVFPGPPGSSAFTVTPVSARSLDQTTVAASSAAFAGPYGEKPSITMVKWLVTMLTMRPQP